jgi:hypothetical protein
VKIGPPPYYHRPDCHNCLKQDGRKTGSELLDELRGVDYLAQRPPLTASRGAAEAMSRTIREQFERS